MQTGNSAVAQKSPSKSNQLHSSDESNPTHKIGADSDNDGDIKMSQAMNSSLQGSVAHGGTAVVSSSQPLADGDEKSVNATKHPNLAPAVRELRLTHQQAAQEWASICHNKSKLDAITLAAAKHTLTRFTVSGKSKGGASKRYEFLLCCIIA